MHDVLVQEVDPNEGKEVRKQTSNGGAWLHPGQVTSSSEDTEKQPPTSTANLKSPINPLRS